MIIYKTIDFRSPIFFVLSFLIVKPMVLPTISHAKGGPGPGPGRARRMVRVKVA
jgi:hypothetical protein